MKLYICFFFGGGGGSAKVADVLESVPSTACITCSNSYLLIKVRDENTNCRRANLVFLYNVRILGVVYLDSYFITPSLPGICQDISPVRISEELLAIVTWCIPQCLRVNSGISDHDRLLICSC